MKRRMEAVTISVSKDGDIHLQADDYGAGEQFVSISPDQVDTLIEWLKEAKMEAFKIRNG